MFVASNKFGQIVAIRLQLTLVESQTLFVCMCFSISQFASSLRQNAIGRCRSLVSLSCLLRSTLPHGKTLHSRPQSSQDKLSQELTQVLSSSKVICIRPIITILIRISPCRVFNKFADPEKDRAETR